MRSSPPARTGAHAIGDAARLIALDDADVMVAGGSEGAICPLGIAGFAQARALSTGFNDTPEKASRPYDRDRDGFVMAEGAGIVVLEEYERAKARGAKIYAEVIGYGLTGDAYHVTAPHPEGSGRVPVDGDGRLRKAGLNPSDIDYINAHGTSTPMGDELELGAVRRLFGNAIGTLSMSSTKSATGHLLGGAGAVESIFCALAIRDQIVPPTLNLRPIRPTAARASTSFRMCPSGARWARSSTTASASAAPTRRWCSGASDAWPRAVPDGSDWRVAFGLLLLAFGGALLIKPWFRGTGAPGTIEVVIPAGATVDEAAHRLDDRDVVTSAGQFKLLVRLFGRPGAIKAGVYAFPRGASWGDDYRRMQRGTVVAVRLTIPEGLPAVLVAERLAHIPGLKGAVPDIAEGSVLPDTYSFATGTTRAAAVKSMQDAMAQALAKLWKDAQPGGGSPDPGRGGDAGIDRREGDREARRTRADRRRLFEPAAAGHQARCRPDGDLSGHAWPAARAAHPAFRACRRQRLQHLCTRRAAGRADRQSRARLDRGGARAGGHQGALLRRRRQRRARLCRHAGAASGERREMVRAAPGARRAVSMLLRVAALAVLAWGLGFAWFTATLPAAAPLATRTDAVVVLTGGPLRLARGLAVLEHGSAQRLLVSGVHRKVDKVGAVGGVGGAQGAVRRQGRSRHGRGRHAFERRGDRGLGPRRTTTGRCGWSRRPRTCAAPSSNYARGCRPVSCW